MFLEDLAADWEQHGAEAIAECRRTDVATYVKLAAALIPREVGMHVSTDATKSIRELSEEQLLAIIARAQPVVGDIEYELIESDAERDRHARHNGEDRAGRS